MSEVDIIYEVVVGQREIKLKKMLLFIVYLRTVLSICIIFIIFFKSGLSERKIRCNDKHDKNILIENG